MQNKGLNRALSTGFSHRKLHFTEIIDQVDSKTRRKRHTGGRRKKELRRTYMKKIDTGLCK